MSESEKPWPTRDAELDEAREAREDCAELLHELEVHKLELEMQNKQLRQSELELAQARDRYFDLFDLAPVAYLTLDRSGLILEANFAAAALLGGERATLLGRRLASFIVPEEAERFHLFHRSLYESGASRACELTCRRAAEGPFPVRMQGIAPKSLTGEQTSASIAIVDLSEIARAHDDLQRKGAELKRTEDRLESFMRTTNDCVLVLSPDGLITAANAATQALLGCSEEELLGRHISTLDHGETPAEAAEVRSTEVVWRDHVGGEHHMVLAISPIREGQTAREYICTARDITERKEAERLLQKSERLLRQMAETVEDGFYVREYPSGELSYVSPSYEKIFGISREELYAQPTISTQLVHPDDVDGLLTAYECFVKGDPCDEQFRIVRPDGEIRWIRERAFIAEEEGGEVERVIGIVQDITDQRQFEIELRQGQKMEAVGQLASGMAHDFNNILMGIHGCASIGLSKLEATSEVRPFLEAIRKSSESGTAIIKQLLVFSTKRELEVSTFDLNGLLVTDESMLARLLGDDIVLRIVTGDSPCWLRMDLSQVQQILMNLAINARDAMPEGGELVIETEVVDGPEPGEGRRVGTPMVVLRVRDTGEGMSEAVRERIFEPFFTTKGIGEGTGLGLSTVYGIVQEAGGSIRCLSEPGQGTTFVVTLPLAPADELDQGIGGTGLETEPTMREGDAGTILLVEDESTVRLATRMYLESAGHEVLGASSGTEALEILEARDQPISLLLTDVGLPGVSGSALAARARSLVPGLPILFMSAHPADWLIEQGRLDPGEPALQKPFSKEELLASVHRLLEKPDS